MRYYDIQVSDPVTGAMRKRYRSTTDDGSALPAALLVELDIIVTEFAVPIGQSMVRVHGVPLTDIAQSSDLNGSSIKVYGGMSKGLPLAQPQQAGLLLQGVVFQAFGNWIGTDMTLDLIVTTDGGTALNPKNIVLDWAKGQQLGDAVAQALKTAFPSYRSPVVSVSASLVRQDRTLAYYQSLEQLAEGVQQLSQEVDTDAGYSGIKIVDRQGQFYVYDGTTPSAAKAILFTDLVGQPTWIEAQEVQLTTVLRADVAVGDYVMLPQTQVGQTSASQPQARDKSAFQGTFQVDFVRHVGNSRNPSAQSWVTTFNCHPSGDPA